MRKTHFFGVFVVVAALSVAVVAEGAIRDNITRSSRALYREGEIIVQLKGEDRFRRVRLGGSENVEAALARFRGRADVLYAEPNYIAYAFAVPNDPYYSYQWHFDNSVYGGIHMEDAWDTSQGAEITVAVIDTGVAYENNGFFYKQAPDLAGTAFTAGYDFVENDTHPNDDNGHGTHVTGTIAGTTNNNVGVAGIAHKAAIMPIKVLDSRGSGSYADVADGIRWAADHGANVINLSLGGSVGASYLEDAVRYAYEKGVTIVAAAGNDNAGSVSYPAAYNNYVIAVGATRFDETRAPYSNYGAGLDIVAPGGDLSVDQNGDGYGDGVLQQTINGRPYQFAYFFYQGTSMATPHVAGVAALVMSHGNATTPDAVRTALQTTADDLGVSGRDDIYGWGLVNAASALQYASGPVDNPPTVSITAPTNGVTVNGGITISANASDDNGIARVDFYLDNTLFGTDASAPYEISWNSVSVGDGTYTIKATAVDTINQSVTDSVGISVDNVNDPPVADAGADQTVIDGDDNGTETVALNGSNSFDPDGSIVSYEWEEGSTVLATTVTANIAFAVGTHSVTLTVIDNGGSSSSAELMVTVNPYVNQPPVADAGSDQTVVDTDDNGVETVTLNASGSADPDGSIVSYLWEEEGTTIGTASIVSHEFAVGSHAVTLTVTDDKEASASDTMFVVVQAKSSGPTVIFFDDFESGSLSPKWAQSNQFNWTVQTASEQNISGMPSSNKVGHADGCGSSGGCVLATANSMDLTPYTTAALKFWRFVDRSLDRGEFLRVEVFNGSSWQTLFEWTHRNGDDDTWHYETVDISSFINNNFQLRFTSKENSSGEDTEIDDVLIEVL